MKKFNVGIVGATGMVGQRFMTLLENHPLFLQHHQDQQANLTAKLSATNGVWTHLSQINIKKW